MRDYLASICADNPTVAAFNVTERVLDEAGADIVEGRPLYVWDEDYCTGIDDAGNVVVRFRA